MAQVDVVAGFGMGGIAGCLQCAVGLQNDSHVTIGTPLRLAFA
jgi:hypothetical protein